MGIIIIACLECAAYCNYIGSQKGVVTWAFYYTLKHRPIEKSQKFLRPITCCYAPAIFDIIHDMVQ